jgi:hypothetical protein
MLAANTASVSRQFIYEEDWCNSFALGEQMHPLRLLYRALRRVGTQPTLDTPSQNVPWTQFIEAALEW